MEFHCLLPWCQEDELPPDLPPQNHGCRRELVRYRRPCPGLRRVSYTHFNETEFLHGRPFLSRYVVSFACDSKNFLILYCIIFDKLLISIAYVRGHSKPLRVARRRKIGGKGNSGTSDPNGRRWHRLSGCAD